MGSLGDAPHCLAIASTVRKPKPLTWNRAYGCLRIISIERSWYCFRIIFTFLGVTWKGAKKVINSRNTWFFPKDSMIPSSFFFEIPRTFSNFSGVFSIISNVFNPNWSTIRSAIFGPTPFTEPQERYPKIPSLVLGTTSKKLSTLYWSPWVLDSQFPSISTSISSESGRS